MILLGSILVLLGGGAIASAFFGNVPNVDFSAFGVTFSNVNVGLVFLFGAAAGVALMLGASLLSYGSLRRGRRSVSHYRERRGLRKQNQRLSADLERERERPPADAYPTETGAAARTDSAATTVENAPRSHRR